MENFYRMFQTLAGKLLQHESCKKVAYLDNVLMCDVNFTPLINEMENTMTYQKVC